MNWMRVLLGGVAAGVVMNINDFVMHGNVMANAYKRYPVFSQTPANPMWFVAVALCLGCTAALLFARTRACWAPGARGGVTFGAFLGLALFFRDFYDPLVFEGMPYHLAWCWGGISMIGNVLGGAVLGALIQRAE